MRPAGLRRPAAPRAGQPLLTWASPSVAVREEPGQQVPAPLVGELDHQLVAGVARAHLAVVAKCPALPLGKHDIEIVFDAKPFGKLKLNVQTIAEAVPSKKIPRDATDDYSPEAIRARQTFVEEFTGSPLDHVQRFSFDPHLLKGNVEHFTGVAQVPDRHRRAATVNGEHAQGDFIIPMATTEGTLVASYNRGIALLNANGGVKCTVVNDAMQRAPVFVFDDARAARAFIAGCRRTPRRSRKRPSPPAAWRSSSTSTPTCQQVRLPALQLPHGRRGGAEHGRARHLRGLLVDPRPVPRGRHFYLETTSPPTRRRRRSTSCARAASG